MFAEISNVVASKINMVADYFKEDKVELQQKEKINNYTEELIKVIDKIKLLESSLEEDSIPLKIKSNELTTAQHTYNSIVDYICDTDLSYTETTLQKLYLQKDAIYKKIIRLQNTL